MDYPNTRLHDQFHTEKLFFASRELTSFQRPLSRWVPDTFLMTLRCLSLLYGIIMLLLSAAVKDSLAWIADVTTWIYIVAVAYFLFASISSIAYVYQRIPHGLWTLYHHNGGQQTAPKGDVGEETAPLTLSSFDELERKSSPSRRERDCERLLKVTWFLFCLGLNLTMSNSILYWCVVFRASTLADVSVFLFYLEYDRHGVIVLLMLIEFFFNSFPVQLLHVVYPTLFASTYFLFGAIYLGTKDHIAHVLSEASLSWKLIGYFLVLLVLITGVQVLLYGLYRFKTAMFTQHHY